MHWAIVPFILFSLNSLGAKVSCTHPQVASILNDLYSQSLLPKEERPSFVALFESTAGLHDFEPTIQDFKKIKASQKLIFGPLGHQKWLLKAKSMGVLPQETFHMDLSSLEDEHFWLYPKGYCTFESKILPYLKETFNHSEEIMNSISRCKEVEGITAEIQNVLRSLAIKTVILSHPSLVQLFKATGLKYLTLHEDDHDKEVPPQTLKKLSQWIDTGKKESAPSILYIQEPLYPTPQMINLGIKSNTVKVFKWNPLEGKPTPLKDLLSKLRELQ